MGIAYDRSLLEQLPIDLYPHSKLWREQLALVGNYALTPGWQDTLLPLPSRIFHRIPFLFFQRTVLAVAINTMYHEAQLVRSFPSR